MLSEADRRTTRNLTSTEWRTHVGPEVPYRRTSKRHPVHPSMLREGSLAAREGRLADAVSTFEHALTLQPDPDLSGGLDELIRAVETALGKREFEAAARALRLIVRQKGELAVGAGTAERVLLASRNTRFHSGVTG